MDDMLFVCLNDLGESIINAGYIVSASRCVDNYNGDYIRILYKNSDDSVAYMYKNIDDVLEDLNRIKSVIKNSYETGIEC